VPETFLPLVWHNNTFPAINEGNLNRIEVGLEALDDRAAQLELGVATPVVVPFATAVTLNATQGSLFRCTATGDLTLDDIVGGTDGQTIVFEVLASGAARTLFFTGSVTSVSIATNQQWAGSFRYRAASDSWIYYPIGGGTTTTSGVTFTPVPMSAVSGVLTPNASLGSGPHRHSATENVTLASPTGGYDGQPLDVQVFASGSDRVLIVAGAGITIPVGQWWWGRLSRVALTDTWILDDSSGGASGGTTSSGASSAGIYLSAYASIY
jgi:hypothetical protein